VTCVIGFKAKDENKIYIGADTIGSTNYTKENRKDGKVFASGDFTIGFAGSYRMGQVLQYKLDVPAQKDSQTDHGYMATTFIDAVRRLFDKNGIMGVDHDNKEFGGLFLVAYKNELYRIDYDFQVGIGSEDFTAIGSGGEVALGAMYALNSFDEVGPTEKVTMSILAAMDLTPFVGGDIEIVSHTYVEETAIDKVYDKLSDMTDEDLLEIQEYLDMTICDNNMMALGVDECE